MKTHSSESEFFVEDDSDSIPSLKIESNFSRMSSSRIIYP